MDTYVLFAGDQGKKESWIYDWCIPVDGEAYSGVQETLYDVVDNLI